MDFQLIPLRESDIDRSLSGEDSVAYEALVDEKMVGGAIVVIDNETQRNHLDFLYVKNDLHDKGIGYSIWTTIEKLHPKTKVWETYTPYFEKRNINFYVNRCGFHIVEFFNKHHSDPNDLEGVDEMANNEYFDGMFRFEKIMENR